MNHPVIALHLLTQKKSQARERSLAVNNKPILRKGPSFIFPTESVG